MIRRNDDILLKSAIEEAFSDLLCFCFRDADQIFDWDRGFEFLDKELMEISPGPAHKGSRFVDMLVKVFLRTGSEEWILVHVEVQRRNEKIFPERMLQYWYRIYDKYGVNVAALAVYTGSLPQERKNCFHKSFLGTEITYRYNLYHILDHSEEELLRMQNRFAWIVLAAQKTLLQGRIPEAEMAEGRLKVARALIESGNYSREQIIRFLYFLKNFIRIEDPEINHNFDREIGRLTKRKNAMGIIEAIKMLAHEEGIEKGMEKGREEAVERRNHEFVKSLLCETDFSVRRIASLVGVTDSFVRKVKRQLKNDTAC